VRPPTKVCNLYISYSLYKYVAASILNRQLQTSDKGWSSSLGIW
jgi:hypothetical protein